MGSTTHIGTRGMARVQRTLSGTYEVVTSREYASEAEALAAARSAAHGDYTGIDEVNLGLAQIAEACASTDFDGAQVYHHAVCEYVVGLLARQGHPVAERALKASLLVEEAMAMPPLFNPTRAA